MSPSRSGPFPKGWRTAARISLVYLVAASIWLYVADGLMAQLASRPQLLAILRPYQGWLFIVMTTLLLFGLIGNALTAAGVEQPAGHRPDDQSRPAGEPLFPSSWSGLSTPVLIFLLLAGAIGGIGYLVYAYQKDSLQREKQNELLTIADTKVAQISNWLAERRKDAQFIAGDPFVAQQIGRSFAGAATTGGNDAHPLLTWLANLKDTYGYSAVMLLDEHGEVRLGIGSYHDDVDRQTLARQAMQAGRVIVSDLHRRPETPEGNIEIDIVVPLQRGADGGSPAGAIYLQVNPGQYLFPLLQTWPTASASAETLLVRQENEDILYLNELRFQNDTALALRLPLSDSRLPAAMAIGGREGIVEGLDYRQVPVIAALRRVPDTAWFLIAKVDANEVYAPVRTMMLFVATLAAVLIAGAGLGASLWWRQQHATFLANYYQGQLERQALLQQAESARRENEARLHAIANAVPDVLMLIDAGGRYLEILTSQPQLLYTTPADLKGRLVSEVLPAEAAKRVLEAVSRTLATGEIQVVEYDLWISRIGKRRFETRTAPIQAPGTTQPAVVLLARDITQRQLTEEKLRHAQKMEAIGQLTGGVAHDFNNLLAIVIGNLELLDEELTARPDLRDLVHRAFTAADRGATLTQRLLAYSRQQPLQPKPINLNELVTGMTDLLKRTLGASIQIKTALADDLRLTLVDPVQFETALLNLVLNARDAMPRGGELTIATANRWLSGEQAGDPLSPAPAGQYVMLAVTDTGVGMTPAVLERACEPFFTTKEVGKGSGLGLSMVYGFVSQSNGYVNISSEAGEGTTVTILLPSGPPTAALPEPV